MHSQISWALVLLIAIVGVGGSGYFLFVRYVGLPPGKAFGAWLVAVIGGTIAWCFRFRALRELQVDSDSLVVGCLAAAFFVFLATAFVLRVRAKWLEGTPNDPENLVGVPGYRAWFTLGNLFVAALLTFLAWVGFGIPFAVTLLVTCGALALKPLLTATARDHQRGFGQPFGRS